MHRLQTNLICLIFGLGFLPGCQSIPSERFPHTASERIREASDAAARSGFTRIDLEDRGVANLGSRDAQRTLSTANESNEERRSVFPSVAVWIKPNATARFIRVYIEGDGLAFVSRRRISDDPTPRRPVALELAGRDPGEASLIYLGRPCQYGGAKEAPCRPALWSFARFGEENLAAMNGALSRALEWVSAQDDGTLPPRRQSSDSAGGREGTRAVPAAMPNPSRKPGLQLIGYSGGGVMAALLAASRDDVESIVTIASPLDHAEWTRLRNASPLVDSLSPMDFTSDLRRIPQLHLVGGRDRTIPRVVVDRFADTLENARCVRVVARADRDHSNWAELWPDLLRGSIDALRPSRPCAAN